MTMASRESSPVWHPFTQHALKHHFPSIVRADGAYLFSADGERIIDAISSWWVITHGHCHPRIVAAIQSQAAQLDQLIFAEYTHAAAEQVAHRLLELAPSGLSHVFYTDSGSTSVEVALKMALGYWRHRGEPRHRIVVMDGSYHGDTVGAMSVGARGVFTLDYEPLLFDVARIAFPSVGQQQQAIDQLESLCARGDIAAFLVEPLVLGAGGMRMYTPQVLAQLRAVCERHHVLFIADEVMTGWGRTGSLFACQKAGIMPDILCSSKGLTGGALPLAVTLCRPPIFEAHYATDRRRTFFHSSSFTANPIACAAALANLDVWAHEDTAARVAALERMQSAQLQSFRQDARFTDVRQMGTITALELAAADEGYLAAVGPRLQESFRAARVLLRPLGNTIYVLPPYCVTQQDLNHIYDAIRSAVAALD
jgi:adenosylmethionine-8-amino-7-oxononanoate aminotransferase